MSWVKGRQAIQKFYSQGTPWDIVDVYLGVVRVPSVTTDIVVTFHVPLMQCPGLTQGLAHVTVEPGQSQDDVFLAMLQSLVVCDWGLFGV